MVIRRTAWGGADAAASAGNPSLADLAGYYERHAARPSFKSTNPPPGPPSPTKPN
jgi:glutathione S-transferase